MIIRGRALGLAFAAVLAVSNGLAFAQCQTCQNSSTGTVGSWPQQQGCGQSGCGNHGNFKQTREEMREQNAKISARNAAWMKPFNCYDHTSVNAVWGTMIDSGWQANCTLSDAHFEPNTGKLNTMGKQKIAQILSANSSDAQKIFIGPSADSTVADSRLEQVRTSVAEWFGDDKASLVVAGKIQLPSFNGARVQAVNTAYLQGVPVPTVITSSSSSSSGSSGSSGSGSSGSN